MLVNCVIISSLLLCTVCFDLIVAEIQSNVDRDNPSKSDLQPNGNSPIKPKIKFTELNDDVLHVIFMLSNLTALVNFAEINPNYAYLTGRAFREKYQNYQITLMGLDGVAPGENSMEFPENAYLSIEDYELSKKTVKYFGHYIKKLTIKDSSFEGIRSQTINQMVNNFTCESATHLNLASSKEHAFSQFTKPWLNVEEVACQIHEKQIGDILLFNEIFPNLKRFTLVIDQSDVDYNIFDAHMPHLELLMIRVVNFQYGWMHSIAIDGLVRKNAHILRASFFGFPDNYIRTVNQLMPNVTDLTIDNFNLGTHFVHMENVKHFALKIYVATSIDQLSFSRLESIEMKLYSDVFTRWMMFFRNHRNLTKLFVDSPLIEEEFTEITTELPDLVDLLIQFIDEISSEAIITFIETHDKLQRFEVTTRSQLDLEHLHEVLGNKWNISHHIKFVDVLLFEKKIDETEGDDEA